MKRGRKQPLERVEHISGAKNPDAALTQQVVERLHVCLRAHRCIGQDKIQVMHREVCEELVDMPLSDDQVHSALEL